MMDPPVTCDRPQDEREGGTLAFPSPKKSTGPFLSLSLSFSVRVRVRVRVRGQLGWISPQHWDGRGVVGVGTSGGGDSWSEW